MPHPSRAQRSYEKAKELKRKRDKEMRDKLKKSAKKVSKQTKSLVSSDTL